MPRVISDTPDAIVIEDRPVALAVMLGFFILVGVSMVFEGVREGDPFMLIFGAGFAVGLWFMIGYAVRRVRLVLRPDGSATLEDRGTKDTIRRDFPPGTLRAGLATDYSKGRTHRVILLVEAEDGLERLPLTRYLGGSSRHDTIVQRINSWASQEPSEA